MVKFLPFEYNTGAENMRIDKMLLDEAISNNLQMPIFRLYGWRPACISLGRNQKEGFFDENILKENEIDVVRRLTGGRALLHDKEITYSIVLPCDYFETAKSVMESYREICKVLIKAFNKMGINLTIGGDSISTKYDYCMLVSTGADLNYNGKKLIGSAQYRSNGYILQHGSILYDYDAKLLSRIFRSEIIDTSHITSIKEILPFMSMEEFGILFQDTVRDVLLNI